MQKKVYISSTFRDLKDHREKVIDFFQKFPEKFDLVAMENYVAENIPPVQKCIEDVKNCDIYILLLANRYGFIPEGSTVSVTETEYQTARQYNKQILAFIAADSPEFPPDMDGNIEEKKAKLAQFRQAVRTALLTHPEPFISPDNLTVQVSESLMKRLFLDYQISDKRKLCCNRNQQFGQYLKSRFKSRFKVFILHGRKKELGRNMINRILFFTLHTGVLDQLPYHLVNELMLNDYESTKDVLVANILEKDLHLSEFTDASLEHLTAKIDERPYPSFLVVLEGNVKFIREKDYSILKQFCEDFYNAYKEGQKQVYLFLNMVDESDEEERLLEAVQPLVDCNPSSPYVFCLPRLKPANTSVVEQWISTYLTGDEENILELMEKHFSPLLEAEEFTMQEAQKSIEELLDKINSGDQTVIKLINA